MTMRSRARLILLALVLSPLAAAFGLGACASLASQPPEPFPSRPRALAGVLARAGHDARSPLALATRARIEETLGRPEAAIGSWIAAAERAPALRPWAAVRLLSLLDDAPLESAWLARMRALPELAEVAESLALRLGDAAAVAEARARLGVAFDWRRSERLLRYPGDTASPALDPSRFGDAMTSGAGFIASPEGGAGLYAFALELPPGRHRVVVDTECAIRAFVGGQPIFTHDALSALLPTRVEFPVELAPGQPLELHLVGRTAVVAARVFVLPPAAPDADANARGLPADLPIAVLSAFELALARRDIDGAHHALSALPPASYFAHLAAARAALTDPSRAPERARQAAKHELALALAREPDAAEARRLLVRLHAGDQEIDDALRLLGSQEDLGPVLHDAAIAAYGQVDPPRAAALALAAVAQRPRSCRARADWLDTGWERLDLHPGEVRAAFEAALAPLPGLCFDTHLRAAEVLRQGFDLDGAAHLTAPLLAAPAPAVGAGLDPGPDRARAEAFMATVEIARGRWSDAGTHARAALRWGGADTFAGELLARAERLQGGPPAPRIDRAADLGMPLSDARALITAHLERAARAPALDGREVLLDDRFVRVHADGSLRIRVHQIVRVNDVNAVESVGELPIPDDAEVLFVRTWKHERAGLRPLEPEDILEKSTVSLPALAAGDYAEWAYFHPIHASPRLAPGWRAPTYAFDSESGPVGLARYTVSLAPGALTPVFVVDAAVPPPAHPDATTWVFTARDQPRVFREPLDPRPDTRRATLRASSGIQHLPLARALAAEAAYATRASPTLQAMLADATAGLPPDAGSDQVLKALYDAVRRRVDEPEDATPFDVEASWVADRRRGSRALLLAALCREAGLACELVLARPLWEGPETREVELERLSYPLVRWSPLGRPAIWLDPTGRWMPFGLLPPSLEGVFALSLGGAREPALLETPTTPPGEDPAHWGQRRIALHVAFDAKGGVVVDGEETVDGVFAASWRVALTTMSPQARDKILAAMVQQVVPDASVDSVELSDLEDDTRPLTWRWRAKTRTKPPTRAREDGARSLVLALFPEGLTRDTLVLAERETPLLVDRAARMSLTLTADAPPGWGFVNAPGDVSLSFDLGHLERASRFEALGTRVVVDKRFLLRPGVVEPSRYAAWSDAAVAIDRADLVELVVAPGSSAPNAPRGSPR